MAPEPKQFLYGMKTMKTQSSTPKHIKSEKELESIQKNNENKPKSLLEHRDDLRNKTAYPVLRGVLLLSAICGFVIWLLVGFLIADQYGVLSFASCPCPLLHLG